MRVASTKPDVNFLIINGSPAMDFPMMTLVFLPNCWRAMHIYYTNMHLAEESKLPNLFTVSGYLVYFWANEGNEPIHVHISKGHPYSGSTKVGLTRDGGCILASNGSKIPNKELNELMDFIAAQFFYICDAWKTFFLTDTIHFYC